jgi:4-amino-4-deoxy-L-arabinose transferase-like glycosyltransferase
VTSEDRAEAPPEPADPVGGRAFRWGLVALCVLAAVATALVAERAFPDGSSNLDEAAYQAQANALVEGKLTLPAETHMPHFQPFLSGVREDRVIFKYQPVWPALIAASDTLFGSSLPVRLFMSLTGVLAVVWFAWELTRNRGVALVAGLLVAASPFAWVQTASMLGYQLSFVLGAAAAAALLYALRRGTFRAGALAGALVGLGALHRPFDAALAVAPVVAYAAWRASKDGRLGRFAAAVAAGGLPFAAAFFAYNAATMGSPLRMPFNVSGRIDKFGFGWRASFEVEGGGRGGQIHYTVGEALETLRHFWAVLPRFVAFAPAVLACIVVLLVRRPRDRRTWLLVAMIGGLVVGYFFWWGSANAFHFKLERPLGPFYGYPLLVPGAVAAAWGFVTLRSANARIAVLLVGVIWAGSASVIVLEDARIAGRARTNEVRQFDGTDRRLVLELPLFPNDPYVRYANDADLSDELIVGTDIPGRRLEVVERFADRSPYLIRVYKPFGDPFGNNVVDRIPLWLLRGRAFAFRLHGSTQPSQNGMTYMRVGTEPPRFSTAGTGRLTADFTLDAGTPGLTEKPVEVVFGVTSSPRGFPPLPGISQQWYECRFEARRTADGGVAVLTPCDEWASAAYPGGAVSVTRQDLRDLIDVEITPR